MLVAGAMGSGDAIGVAASGRVAFGPRKLVFPPGEVFTVEEMNEFKPKVAGCSWRTDTVRHMRWQIMYPTKRKPYSTSLAWNATISEKDSILWCLACAWAEHLRCTGESCPYDLGDE